MRFRTRAFVISFLPLATLLSVSFFMIQSFVQSTVREELRNSLRSEQQTIARIHSRNDLQNNRFLSVVGENAALKAGLQLLVAEHNSEGARKTVEDQLSDLGERMGFDFLMVSSAHGKPLAAVGRLIAGNTNQPLIPLDPASVQISEGGLSLIQGKPFQIGSVALDAGNENIGSLSVGEHFNLSDFSVSAVLLHQGHVVQSNVANASPSDIEDSLHNCHVEAECNAHFSKADWISLPLSELSSHGEFELRSLENIDAAGAGVQRTLHKLFLTVSFGCLLVVFACSFVASRSIVKPIAEVVWHLRNAVRTGVLPEFGTDPSSVYEIRELTESYNRAAASVRQSGKNLRNAYVEFVESLAHALDARDPYTAGHSNRVSELSCAMAKAMGLGEDEIEKLRVGALLHDIGKIGISDTILQKPGRLTDEEFAVIKLHPGIGRRILEGVQGFAPYLPAVELHHENWNGTGYPHRQSGTETPLHARIIHVADAYDAMTTNRSYRSGMTREKAMSILFEYAGIQFDPEIVELFSRLPEEILRVDAEPVSAAPALVMAEVA